MQHGVARGIQMALLVDAPFGVGGLVDYASPQRKFTGIGSPAWSVGQQGAHINAGFATTSGVSFTPAIPASASACTFSFYAFYDAASHGGVGFVLLSDGNASGEWISTQTDINNPIVLGGGPNHNQTGSLFLTSLSGWHRVTVTSTSLANTRWFLDGEFVETGGVTGTAITSGAIDQFLCSTGEGSYSWGWNVSDVFVWNRALSDSEVFSHALSPFETIIRPRFSERWLGVLPTFAVTADSVVLGDWLSNTQADALLPTDELDTSEANATTSADNLATQPFRASPYFGSGPSSLDPVFGIEIVGSASTRQPLLMESREGLQSDGLLAIDAPSLISARRELDVDVVASRLLDANGPTASSSQAQLPVTSGVGFLASQLNSLLAPNTYSSTSFSYSGSLSEYNTSQVATHSGPCEFNLSFSVTNQNAVEIPTSAVTVGVLSLEQMSSSADLTIGTFEFGRYSITLPDAWLSLDWLSTVAPPSFPSTAEWLGSLGQILITPPTDWLSLLQGDTGTSQAQWTIPARYDWTSLAEWGRSTDAASSGSLGALTSTESNSLFWSAPLSLYAANVSLSSEFAGITATISDIVSPIDWRGGIAGGPPTPGDWSTNLQINTQSLAERSVTVGQSASASSDRQIAANRAFPSDLEESSTFYGVADAPAQWLLVLWQAAMAPNAAQNDVSATSLNQLDYQCSWGTDLLATSDIQQVVSFDGEMTTPVDASADIAVTGLVATYSVQYLDWPGQTSLLAISDQVSEYPIEIAETQTGDALSSESSMEVEFGTFRYSASWLLPEWGASPTRHAPAAKGAAVFTRPPRIAPQIRTSTARAKGAAAVAPSRPGKPK